MTASGKPLVVIDESHHAGIVIVVGTLALVMTLICLAIRVYVRTILSPGFGRDDYLLFVATTFAVIQTSLVMSNSAKGFGTSIGLLSSDQVVKVQRFQKWEYIGVMDSTIELMLFLFSILLVKSLQMPTTRKLIVLSSFAVRLPFIVFTSLHLYHLNDYAYSENPTLDIIDAYVWTQMGMNYALIVCTSFCLAPFMRAISVTYGNAGEVTLGTSSARSKSGKYARDVSKQSQSYVLQSMDNHEEISHGMNNPRHSQPTFVPERSSGMVSATAYDGSSRTDGDSVASSESTKMIIKKNVEYTVTHEPR
ncbi:hypothetical protein AbraIFM66951_008834 [Aspergillus brasiliensis]|uniref:Rhodopsin domain-containing protein n=1 Tax=Aspergillus brasiliensis TaxID=319629 RepID=A0A9W5YR77_9EURO|nr:hypothetical protein AbraCBS73388_008032 [Aspergillus brasiliensis]GKZ45958.1 hypothetical protein AbraIFM66951_008834 [Aspergillus brasiliensis]